MTFARETEGVKGETNAGDDGKHSETTGENAKSMSVAIIGAGPCGCAAAKALLAENAFSKIKLFERRSTSGGLWNYGNVKTSIPVPSTDPSKDCDYAYNEKGDIVWPSAIYKYLDTNVPTNLMAYKDEPFPEHVPLFAQKEDVLRYMQRYAEPVLPYTEFNTNVMDVRKDKQLNKWIVKYHRLDAPDDIQTESYDFVLAASGNYSVPYIPEKKGLKEWDSMYKDSVLHAKNYWRPEDFSGKVVLVIGNSASGADIAYQLAQYPDITVYQSSRSENSMPGGKSARIKPVADVEEFQYVTRSVKLVDGTELHDIDNVIFATGYLKSYPYLSSLNEGEHPLITDGQKVHGLYLQLIYYRDPTLAFIGLPRFVLPTRLGECQAAYVARVWSGRLKLPPLEEMKQWEADRERSTGSGKQFHDLKSPADMEYSNMLYDMIVSVKGDYGLVPVRWEGEDWNVRLQFKGIKEGAIAYKQDKGKPVTSVKELIDSGYFKFDEE